MIKILTDDVELLKEVCETLAYNLIMAEGGEFRYYTISDDEISNCLKCKGLKVEVENDR